MLNPVHSVGLYRPLAPSVMPELPVCAPEMQSGRKPIAVVGGIPTVTRRGLAVPAPDRKASFLFSPDGSRLVVFAGPDVWAWRAE